MTHHRRRIRNSTKNTKLFSGVKKNWLHPSIFSLPIKAKPISAEKNQEREKGGSHYALC
jgi:hypothetical protein